MLQQHAGNISYRVGCQEGLGNRWIQFVLWFTQLHMDCIGHEERIRSFLTDNHPELFFNQALPTSNKMKQFYYMCHTLLANFSMLRSTTGSAN